MMFEIEVWFWFLYGFKWFECWLINELVSKIDEGGISVLFFPVRVFSADWTTRASAVESFDVTSYFV